MILFCSRISEFCEELVRPICTKFTSMTGLETNRSRARFLIDNDL